MEDNSNPDFFSDYYKNLGEKLRLAEELWLDYSNKKINFNEAQKGVLAILKKWGIERDYCDQELEKIIDEIIELFKED